jgi:hypothetical protein
MLWQSRFAATRAPFLFTLFTLAACLGPGDAAGSQLTASWVDNSNGGATTRLERRLGTEVGFAAIADVPPGTIQYVDASVSPGTTYCYRAFAYDAAGVSPYTDEVCSTSSNEEFNVTVSTAGNGAGTVVSTPAGILCGIACFATYVAGTAVTLTATPASGSTFAGWSRGSCAGTAPCILAANAPVTVIATFTGAARKGRSRAHPAHRHRTPLALDDLSDPVESDPPPSTLGRP